MVLTESVACRPVRIELPDVDRSVFHDNPPAGAGAVFTDRNGRAVDACSGRGMLARELPELSRTSLFDRDISFVDKVKLFIDIFMSWVTGAPTKQQKNYIAALHHKVTGETLSKKQNEYLLNEGIIKAPVNTGEARALTLIVQFGLAEFKPSHEDQLVVKFIRPDNNESLEQATSELLNQHRKYRLNAQTHDILKSYFSTVDEECHVALAAECLEVAAEKVIESLITRPADLERIFNKIAQFNFWLSIRYILDGKVALEADDAPNELDRIFDNGRGVQGLIGRCSLDPFLLRAAQQILETELSDDASQLAGRVKASAPLLILWLADRMNIVSLGQKRCSHEEAAQIKQALELL